MEFHVVLTCEESKTSKTKSLKLHSEPDTFLDIKKAIEKSFSIPMCVQTLFHQSTKVTDSERLSAYYTRNGDTFQVIYPIEGDCENVIQVVEWLEMLVDAFSHSTVDDLNGSGSFELDELGYFKCAALMSGQYMEVARDLAQNLVFPWTNKTKYVNKLHMDSLGVVRLVMHVYKCTLSALLSETPLYRGHYLVVVCALFVANFTQTFPLRRRIIEHGGLEFCVQTFVRHNLRDLLNSSEAMEVSLYAICK